MRFAHILLRRLLPSELGLGLLRHSAKAMVVGGKESSTEREERNSPRVYILYGPSIPRYWSSTGRTNGEYVSTAFRTISPETKAEGSIALEPSA